MSLSCQLSAITVNEYITDKVHMRSEILQRAHGERKTLESPRSGECGNDAEIVDPPRISLSISALK